MRAWRTRARGLALAPASEGADHARRDLAVEVVELEDDVGEEFVPGTVGGVEVVGGGAETTDEGVDLVRVFDVERGTVHERDDVGEIGERRARVP